VAVIGAGDFAEGVARFTASQRERAEKGER